MSPPPLVTTAIFLRSAYRPLAEDHARTTLAEISLSRRGMTAATMTPGSLSNFMTGAIARASVARCTDAGSPVDLNA